MLGIDAAKQLALEHLARGKALAHTKLSHSQHEF